MRTIGRHRLNEPASVRILRRLITTGAVALAAMVVVAGETRGSEDFHRAPIDISGPRLAPIDNEASSSLILPRRTESMRTRPIRSYHASSLSPRRQQAHEKDQRFERLRNQIEQLDELWDSSERSPLEPTDDANAPAPSAEIESDPAPADQGQTEGIDAAPATEVDPETDAAVTLDESNVQSGPSTADTAELPTPAPIVTGEIDRLGLADSLFAAGDMRRALGVYAQLANTDLSVSQQRWVAYQHACCLRKMGQLSEAERRYRLIVTEHPTHWLSDVCRWWLVHLDDQRRLTANSDKLRQILAALEQESEHEFAQDHGTPTR